MTQPLFRFEDVGVVADGATILDRLILDLPDGGITCVIGPSGAGKTTLLRLCDRLEVPTSGRVLFRGDDVATLDPLVLRRRVGMVFQRPTLFGGTVRDNLRVAAPAATDEAFASALERAELPSSFLDRPAADLSGGEAQRACLARTFVTEPEVLLMDEPTSSLDGAPRRALEATAGRLRDEGVPLIWVTHDLAQAERLADHVVVLIGGRVVATGGLSDLRSRPPEDAAAFLEQEPARA